MAGDPCLAIIRPTKRRLAAQKLLGTKIQRRLLALFLGLALLAPASVSHAGHQFEVRRTAPLSFTPLGAYERAVRHRLAIERLGAQGVPGAAGRWRQLGTSPLDFGDPSYEDAAYLGLPTVAGEVDELAYDADHDRVLAAVGYGGVWQSMNHGRTWTSIGDRLPTQIVGSVAYTPAGNGTILALTGNAEFVFPFGGMGLGVFWSRNDGRTWARSKGVPDGTYGFALAVDARRPEIVYAATGLGLFRSRDAGRTFTNVRLPTGKCAGSTSLGRCFLQNVVTDVAVQAPDQFGHRGGAVVAAVGWPWGNRPSRAGYPEATHNGIYRSKSGRPGTFERIADEGFAPDDRVGRVELAAADGPRQNHDYLYALVQDAKLLRGGLPIDLPGDPAPYPLPTNVNGIYVSADFGATWTKMAGTEDLLLLPTGSSLTPSWVVADPLANQIAPGGAAFYNMALRPDPTRQTAAGVPTRLTFGLEEVWRNELTSQPQNGRSVFRAISHYTGPQCNYLALPVCPFNRNGYVGPTVHVDQHSSLFVPERDGGVTFLIGNDGGVYRQRVGPGEELEESKWGNGSQRGFHTLLVYNVAMARDGVAYAGLQDNGTVRIEPDGRQVGVFGGDGFGVAVDPRNSDLAYGTVQYGRLHATTDGGHTWKSISPAFAGAPFWTPFAMDPKDPNHVIAAAHEVKETVYGPETNSADNLDLFDNPVIPGFPEDGHDPTSDRNWATVFDLGARGGDDVTASAVALYRDSAYVAGCTQCDEGDPGFPFASVLATNVGARKPAMAMTPNGWHRAAAKGLPRRFVTSLTIDPADPRTVYVTLGGYGTHLPSSTPGEETRGMAGGHVYVSHDAGDHFTDVSGDLPDAPAHALVLRGSQLVVGTDVGAFISANGRANRYVALGRGLPIVPVMSLQLKPGTPNVLLVGTYGRGLHTYEFEP